MTVRDIWPNVPAPSILQRQFFFVYTRCNHSARSSQKTTSVQDNWSTSQKIGQKSARLPIQPARGTRHAAPQTLSRNESSYTLFGRAIFDMDEIYNKSSQTFNYSKSVRIFLSQKLTAVPRAQ